MEKLDKKQKHNHKLTDLLKVIIFSCIMIAPIFAIFTQCCIAVFNPNMVDAYSGNIQNVFYDAVDNIASQPIFNWTTLTGIYTPINNMCTGLEFGTSGNILAILLTYWALNTAIYIVFDIIIFCFTKITHFLAD